MSWLHLCGVEGEVGREKRVEFLFDAVGDVVEVVAVVDFELVGDGIAREDGVEFLGGDGDATVFVSGVEADGFHAAKIGDVLVNHIEGFVGVVFRHDWIEDFAVFGGEIDVERGILRIGGPGGGERKEDAGKELEGVGFVGSLGGFGFGAIFGDEFFGEIHAAGAEEIEAGEGFGMAHGDAHGAVATHGMSGEAATGAFGNGAIAGVNIGDEFVDEEVFPIAGDDGVGIEAALIAGEGVGGDEDDFAVAGFGIGLIEDGGEIDPVLGGPVPLVVAVGVAVEEIDDGVAAMGIFSVTGREVDGDVAIGGVAFEVALEGFAVDLDVFDGAGKGGGGGWRGGGSLSLGVNRSGGQNEGRGKKQRDILDFHGQGC